MIKKLSCAFILLIILIVNLLRFWHLDQVPYGFNVDELSRAVTIKCMATEGVDSHLNPNPLFCDLNYGNPQSPIYTYPAMFWAKTFGYTADHLRAFTAFAFLLGLMGLFFLARSFFGSYYALLTILVASISPWIWGVSRLGYESSFTAAFLSWGLFFYFRSNSILHKALAGAFLCASMYAYPPSRLHIPLMIPLLVLFDFKRQGIRKASLISFVMALSICLLPLVQKTFDGSLQKRFNDISIFSQSYLHSIGKTNSLPDLIQVFFTNYFLHFSTSFLFLNGDPLKTYATGHFGLLSWLDILGLLALMPVLWICLKQKTFHEIWFIGFLILNMLIAVIPSGLTNSEIPNTLRIIGAWPFSCLLIGFCFWRLCNYWRFFIIPIILTAAVFAFVFLRTYFLVYPQESKGMFCFWTKEEALNAKTNEDWMHFMVKYGNEDYHFCYYLMNYHGESCSEARKKWQKVHEFINRAKI